MIQVPPFKKLLIANRGEIAIRIARAATELGIKTVGIYSHEDRFALHRFKSDESYKVGTPGKPLEGYLDAKALVDLAVRTNCEAVHPGYGFLSENDHFAELCLEQGIIFVGPSPDILRSFGDKAAARAMAVSAGLRVIPGTQKPLASLAEARLAAQEIGYPVTLKAVSGGGGKGIRMIDREGDLEVAFERSSSEALSSFGKSDLYLEKRIVAPKHIEVQILGDGYGNIVHLYERDCSIQRRHQKVVEVAPALGIPESTRHQVREEALKLCRKVSYQGLGTVEFLVDKDGEAYFLEVNPRVQVEHTVTEEITGVDLLQASILVAAGVSLQDERIGIDSQDSIKVSGAAIQCRITTEDPLRDFAPDTGKVIAYRSAAGFGIRLDSGGGNAGAVITPFYDSLLVKVTASARNLEQAAAKMHRSLSEFRIRGVRHNIPLLKNVVKHPTFLAAKMDTTFFDTNPELFQYARPRDRATKILSYLAEVIVNNPQKISKEFRVKNAEAQVLKVPDATVAKLSVDVTRDNAKSVFDREGAAGLRRWIDSQERLLLTDTTMRDAHQSLFATRLRTKDILNAAPFYRQYGHHFFSLEVWGGATFDTCLRFLKEDPWERLAKVREEIPNVLLQMLLRGDNAVGYTNYPKWVIKDFIKETVRTGLDVFRIFDCLNQPDKMATAIEEVKNQGAIAEVCVCYTGNVADPREQKYVLKYYSEIARKVAAMGADILCIKDMAGLLRPAAARMLVEELKSATQLPIHLHTHDTAGVGVSMQLAAAQAGCDIVDGAVSSMAGLTSQPSLNALIAAMEGTKACPEVPLAVVDQLARYWEGVRTMYRAYDPGILATSTDVYTHEIPGGQYSNLFEQAMKVGLSAEEFYELTKRYAEVNEIFGNIVKVTPSSKVVGDMALLLQKHGLTGESYLKNKPALDYPDSVMSFFQGHMGIPYGGFPEGVRTLVLGPNAPEPHVPEVVESDNLEMVKKSLSSMLGREATTAEALSSRLYPKVFKDYCAHQDQFGKTEALTTPVFFYGIDQNEEIETELEPGMTLNISLGGISNPDAEGLRTVFFNLNGYSRSIDVVDQSSDAASKKRPKAEAFNEMQIGAAMPGKVLDIKVKVGDSVRDGDPLLVTESMKMEYIITAKTSGVVKNIHVSVRDQVDGGDLLMELSK